MLILYCSRLYHSCSFLLLSNESVRNPTEKSKKYLQGIVKLKLFNFRFYRFKLYNVILFLCLLLSFQRGPVNFFLDNLQSGAFYRIILYSVNIRGRSEALVIDQIEVKDAAKLTGKYSYKSRFTLNYILS